MQPFNVYCDASHFPLPEENPLGPDSPPAHRLAHVYARRPPLSQPPRRLRGILVLCLGLFACNDDTLDGASSPTPPPTETATQTPGADVAHPAGWTDATHDSDDAPNYDVVFPDEAVNRLDITIAASDWQAMQDQLTSLAGEFGAGGQGTGNPGGPPMDTTACDGKSAGDTCTSTLNGVEAEGTCLTDPMGGASLICIANPSDAAVTACEGQSPGAVCSYTDDSGTAVDGQCTGFPGQPLACSNTSGQPGQPPDDGGGLDFFGDDLLWVPSTVQFQGVTWWDVGIRFKGNSSLSNAWTSGSWKLPFKLDFDQFEDEFPEIKNQRFYGFKHLSLSNGVQDDSLMHEKLMDALLRAAGIPVARAAFYRIYLDVGEGPTYFGLYTVVEMPESDLLEHEFGNSKGNLYKPEGTAANWTTFDEATFAKENNEEAADWSDVQAAIAALNADRSDASTWRSNLEQTFNTDGFLRWLAFNTLAVNWDAYGQLAHNYYLYNDPSDDNRLQWIPWDQSLAFSSNSGMGSTLPIDLSTVSSDWPLIRFLMDNAVYAERYRVQLGEVMEQGFALDSTQALIERYHALIAPFVVGAEGEVSGYSNLSNAQAFEASVETLKQHVADRRALATEYLTGTARQAR